MHGYNKQSQLCCIWQTQLSLLHLANSSLPYLQAGIWICVLWGQCKKYPLCWWWDSCWHVGLRETEDKHWQTLSDWERVLRTGELSCTKESDTVCAESSCHPGGLRTCIAKMFRLLVKLLSPLTLDGVKGRCPRAADWRYTVMHVKCEGSHRWLTPRPLRPFSCYDIHCFQWLCCE